MNGSNEPQGYEVEVAKEGKSNNLAAAMTFFIAANVVAYHQTEMPSDADTDKLFQSLQQTMAKVPALAAMSNVEKQQMHDWLICMGGFSLTNYMDAKQNRDAQALATIKDFADYSMRIVLGRPHTSLKELAKRIWCCNRRRRRIVMECSVGIVVSRMRISTRRAIGSSGDSKSSSLLRGF